jgi:hypothetical protein
LRLDFGERRGERKRERSGEREQSERPVLFTAAVRGNDVPHFTSS